MEKEFVSYEVAVALKKLGFDEKCLAWHNSTKLFIDNYENYNSKMRFDYCCSIPLKQQVFRWFREKYDVDYYISKQLPNIGSKFSDGRFAYSVVINVMYYPFLTRDTYEKAENACIDKLIELSKQQSNIDDTLSKQQDK